MAKAVFTTSESSAYDDQPEVRYHFPKTYLRQAEAATGDLIVYYEPRRTNGPHSRTGRQAYFAVARVLRIERDPVRPDHYYAYVGDFLEFDHEVPFNEKGHYYESALMKADGTTSKGAFGRAVRTLGDAEFEAILRAGFTRKLEPWESPIAGAAEAPIQFPARPIAAQVVMRPFRDGRGAPRGPGRPHPAGCRARARLHPQWPGPDRHRALALRPRIALGR